jgi:hypothetical protein
MQYILLIYGDERVWASMSKAQMDATYAAHQAYADELTKAGVIRGGAELQRVRTAKSVRFANGTTSVTDGPFAETKEQLGGYYVIEAPSLEEAIRWAAKMPGMTEGTVEVRPLGEGA